MMGFFELLVIAIIISFPVVGAYMGDKRGSAFLGVVLGIFLGPLGWIILFFIPIKYKYTCPYCMGGIPDKAVKCMHCGSDIRDALDTKTSENADALSSRYEKQPSTGLIILVVIFVAAVLLLVFDSPGGFW